MEKKKGLAHEFKEFISRGNVMDLAVGIIIGSAFTKIVSSLVNDIIMPIVGVILGGVNFSNLVILLRHETARKPELLLTYGNFIQAVVDFLFIAVVVFFLIKGMNSFRSAIEKATKEEQEPVVEAVEEVTVDETVVLLTQIRDALTKES